MEYRNSNLLTKQNYSSQGLYHSKYTTKSKLKIIALDNEEGTLTALKSLLDVMGHELSTFTSSVDALDSLKHQPFDLALIDYRLPGPIDGLSVIKKIQSTNNNTKCFLVTGDNSVHCSISKVKIIHKPLTPQKIHQIFED